MLAEIEERGACVAWSPLKTHRDVIALGTKDSGGVGFDDYGGELELYSLCLSSDSSPAVLASSRTSARFSSLGWSSLSGCAVSSSRSMGLVAGGMSDGTVNVWCPSAMLLGDPTSGDPLVVSSNEHATGPVGGLDFNPHAASAHLLATGGSDGGVLITSLERPDAPSVFAPSEEAGSGHTGPVTDVCWNSQVSHIVASASGDGSAVVWDLRQKKPWCRIREAGRAALSAAVWNPVEGLHLVTASSDDASPDVKLWDLRASTSVPLGTMSGHDQGVLSVAWCPDDAGLVLSCGKDGRSLLWDLYTMRPIYDIPNEAAGGAADASGAAGMYGGLGSGAQQRRYDAKWSPTLRGVVSTCSFDRRVQAHSMAKAFANAGRPPKWLKRPSGVSAGFGGKFVSFDAQTVTAKIRHVVEDERLVAASRNFEGAVARNDIRGLCRNKSENATTKHESQVWAYLRILFEENARSELLLHLGFDAVEIEQAASKFSESFDSSDWSAVSNDDKPDRTSSGPMSKKAEDTVKRALLVGNFDAAVECCFRSGNLADALILASCGGHDLWVKTQKQFFEVESKNKSFLSIVRAVSEEKFDHFVDQSDLAKWDETLAVLSVYGKSDAFPPLCERLGVRLEETLDIASAALCYLFSLSLERAIGFWLSDLDHAGGDALALQAFVEKVTVFGQACRVDACAAHPAVAERFTQYAGLLADQGLFSAATNYVGPESPESAELRHMLYRITGDSRVAGGAGFPTANVGVTPAATPAAADGGGQRRQQYQQVSGAGGYQQTAYQQPAAQVQAAVQGVHELPQGWVEVIDPSSGVPYYCNQSTGETQWERPQPAPGPSSPVAAPSRPMAHQPAAQNYNDYGAQQNLYQQPQQAAFSNVSSPMKASTENLVSKYGDGFVSSASNPKLAQQYGNTGTSNPYAGAERPGTAAASLKRLSPGHPQVAQKIDYSIDDVPQEFQRDARGLHDCLTGLEGMQLSAVERKQASEIKKGYAVLWRKMCEGSVEGPVADELGAIVGAIQARNYAVASGMQAKLANEVWKEHKDWLRGMKFLIQIASKRI